MVTTSASAQKVIPLYRRRAGLGELAAEGERVLLPIFNTEVVTSLKPSLTVFQPEPSMSNGTAVVICPGGAFHALSINMEGNDVAKWLVGKGVTAFVLRYRLVPSGDDAVNELMSKTQAKMQEDSSKVVPLAIADGGAAVSSFEGTPPVWRLAAAYWLDGFLRRWNCTAANAFKYSADSRPDFVAPIYAYMGVITDTTVPGDAPPAFIVAASDDQLGLALDSISIYSKWIAAKKSAEIHMYAKGGHGFGMRKQNLPTDQWIERFGEWLQLGSPQAMAPASQTMESNNVIPLNEYSFPNVR
jgi:acetyl esterase/lipase